MNCKPGDLAVYVRSDAGNEGRIVEVVRLMGLAPHYKGRIWCRGLGPSWLVRSIGTPLSSVHGALLTSVIAPDAYLRPIRPGDLEDETPTVREREAA